MLALRRRPPLALLAAAPAAGPDRALAALMPVVGGHGNALRFVLAQLPAEDIASARAALAAVRTLRDEAQDLNADLAAEGLPVLSCEALKGFDARGYLWAHLHAM